jgi:hypothetical protein
MLCLLVINAQSSSFPGQSWTTTSAAVLKVAVFLML